jgi:CheY-like chemotaxis protein
VTRILVVDDDPDVRAFACESLQRLAGARVESAESGDEALRLLRLDHFDVIVCDNRMPGRSGAQALSELAAFDPRTIRIMMTAFIDGRVLEEAVNAGHVHKFLAKPFTAEALQSCVEGALATRA